MTTPTSRDTAKIYPFPPGGRFGQREAGRPAEAGKALRSGPTTFASCGYHETALIEADRSRKL